MSALSFSGLLIVAGVAFAIPLVLANSPHLSENKTSCPDLQREITPTKMGYLERG
jgi:hypothetical protein